MKKKLRARVFLVFMLALFALHVNFVAAPSGEGGSSTKKARIVQKSLAKNGPDITAFTINRFWFQLSKEGRGVDKPDAGYYPKGTANAIYADGLVWAGKVTPDDGQTVRVGGNTYNTGTTAGAIINGVPEDPNGDDVYIYRIRRDYKKIYNEYKADNSNIAIKQDAADTKGVPISDITDKDIDELYAQYDRDWNNWPVAKGAPYMDKNGNGKYDGPTIDEPGIANADQVLWTVANDFEPSAVSNLYKSRPIGIEQQLTVWGYARNDALGDVMFKKYRLINRGTLRVDSMFVAQWSDPDLGNYGDDLAGSDPSLSLGFVYNGNPTDGEYAKFGLPPAAVGYDFFQGPLVVSSDPSKVGIFDLKYRQGYENLGMSSFGYFSAGSTISDPNLGSRADGTYESGTLNWWKLIRGFVPQLGSTKPFYDHNGNPTLYTLSGDPITRIGWVDGGPPSFPPGDRRITLNSGPFEFTPADTQEVVVAVIGGVGADRLSSFAVMRYNDRFAQNAYNVLFSLPKPPEKVPAAMVELDREVVIEWGSNFAKIKELESDVQPGGYAFEGYHVYQLPRGDAPLSEGKRITTFDKANQIGLIFDDIFDPISNQVINYPIINGPDLGIERSISIKTDALRGGAPLANNQPYYFALTAYSYSPLETATPKTLESDPVRFTAYPKQNVGVRFQSEYGNTVPVAHAAGNAGANAEVIVVDPSKTTGNKYEISFAPQHYYLDQNGKWQTTNFPDRIGKVKDVSPSSLDAAAVYSLNGSIDLNFIVDIQSAVFSYADGIRLTFPPGVLINSALNFDAGNGSIEPVINGNMIDFGNVNGEMTENGPFAGGETFKVNVSNFSLPLSVDYIIYDDAYGNTGSQINATGKVTISTINNKFVTQNQWNVKNLTTGQIKLANQTIIGGKDLYFTDLADGPGGSRGYMGADVGTNSQPIFDGLRVSVTSGSYVAPIEYESVKLTTTKGTTLKRTTGAAAGAITLVNYTVFGGVVTSKAIDNFGVGTTDMDQLQQDYELRFTGVLDTQVVNGKKIITVKSGGQMATVFRSPFAFNLRPDNATGVNAPYLTRIPFEVWNVSGTTPRQVNLTFRDREQANSATLFKSWNDAARIYAIVVNSDYNPNKVITVDGGPNADNALATWVWVFYSTYYAVGDKINITYANPIQLGKDTFTFTAPNAVSYQVDLAKQDVEKINVFPNPYYGFSRIETNRFNRFITFTNLPPSQRVVIRIFNLAGQHVRTLEKDDAQQILKWDLRNEANMPAASGMYVVFVDLPVLGKTKTLKIAIIQEQEVLDVF